MRPTPRAVLLFAAGIPLSLLLVLVEGGLWPLGLAYVAAAAALTGLDARLALPGRALRVEVRPPEILYVGDADDLVVELTAPPGRPAPAVELLVDVGPTVEPLPLRRLALAPAEPARLALPLAATRRGTAALHRLWLRWPGPFGLVWVLRRQPLDRAIPVAPNVRAVRHAAIRFTSWDALFGLKPQRQQGDGTEFEALRDYVPGLDSRSIDWKHSARHRRLVCKEFRAERNHQIILAFDTGRLMAEPLDGVPKLDHAINAGLLLAYVALRSGDRIGLFGFDAAVRLYTEPAGGMAVFPRLQRATATLDDRPEETNFTLGLMDLLGRLARRSLVVLLTEFVDTITAELMVENVGRLAARHLVVFVTLQDPGLLATLEAAPRGLDDVTRSVVADDFLRERTIVLERLRRLGVHCLDVPRQQIGADLLNRYLLIKRRELI